MAITWYTSSGQPADSVGVDGDLCWDTLQRITWGPKGKVTAGAWAGTAYSNIGPTGPGVLAGSGAPSSGMGQQGNSYFDTLSGNVYLRGASSWALASTLQTSFSPILQGAGSPSNSTAPNVLTGQLYLDTTNKLLYGPSTSSSYAGLTQSVSLVGPQGPAGAATSFRQQFKGYIWASNTSANTALPLQVPLVTTGGSMGPAVIPVREPVSAAGSISSVVVTCPGSVTAANVTINVLKNGSALWTASNVIAQSSSATNTDGYAKPASTMSFSAGDVLTMTAQFSAAPNACIQVTCYYTLSS